MPLKIESVPVEKLTFDPSNARKHSDANLSAIAQSLQEFGQRKPIVVNADDVIVAGNGTVEAARLLGLTDVDVVRVPKDWSADQVKAFALADNRSAELAEWNPEVLSAQLLELEQAGFDIQALGFDAVSVDEKDEEARDEIPEPPAEANTKLGQVWLLGEHRLMCGDSSDPSSLSILMLQDAPDAVVTDPPYGIGIDGQKQSTSKNPKHNRKAHEFRSWDSERPDKIIFQYIVDLKCPTVIWGGNYFADLLPATRGWIYWSKGQDGLTMSDGELAWTTESKPLRCVTVNRAALQGSAHPTQKPLQVIQFSFDYISAGKVVLDLFGGSGTTLIACENSNRVARVMELDPKYCDVIIERWEKLTGEKAVLEDASR